jgi:glucuronokinase
MRVVLLANAHRSLPRADVVGAGCAEVVHHMQVPTALLPVAADHRACLLDVWVEAVALCGLKDPVLVTNGATYKHFERWATAAEFPIHNLVNDGSTSEAACPGPAASLALLTRRIGLNGSVPTLVILADSAPCRTKFELATLLRAWCESATSSASSYAVLLTSDDPGAPAWPIHRVDSSAGGVLACGPAPGTGPGTGPDTDPGSRTVAVPVLVLDRRAFQHLVEPSHASASERASPPPHGEKGQLTPSLAHLVAQLIQSGHVVRGEALSADAGPLRLLAPVVPPASVGSNVLLEAFSSYLASMGGGGLPIRGVTNGGGAAEAIVCRANARVGVMGNPSDGFFGKTISMSISNFWAEVRLWPSHRLAILPHPLYDPLEFGGLADLSAVIGKEGYEGGVRLLQATCKRFYEHAKAEGIELMPGNFTLAYDTNVPRQVGLAGSSAIITATVRALLQFHRVSEATMPLVQLPSFVLSIEVSELGINAGLQDRVIQTYGGLVYMDFERAHLEAKGRGRYERIPLELAPPLWLAYLADPSDSGKIHSTVRARFDAGDAAVVEGMAQFASLTEKALAAIRGADYAQLGELMDANFALRRRLYGDGALGSQMLKLVAIAQSHGVPCKFPGSGGAVVGLRIPDDRAMEAMQHELERNGCVFVALSPSPELG